MRLSPLVVLLAALATGACAARGTAVNVPRPFPGANVPSRGGDAPPAPIAPVPERATSDDSSETDASAELPATGFSGLVETALAYLGVPYRNGGSDPSGFDCSGLMQWVFAKAGIALPREVKDQWDVGEKISLTNVHAGDLLFFETVHHGASHVGMALGDGRFVHAPSSNGVVRIERYSPYWATRFVGARRVDRTDDRRAASEPEITLPGSVRMRQ